MQNFGRNLEFQPAVIALPSTEDELLDLLTTHRGRRIRAVGRLHSWSDAPRADEILVDLRRFDQVEIVRDGDGWRATIGAGCQIKRVLAELDRQGLTLPSVGLISEQALAGATATGTHGSGKHSLSHYLTGVRLAHYDPLTGLPTIRTIRDGDELRAARCALGCLGVIVAVELRPRPAYQVREWLARYRSLDEVLAVESAAPLQQFFLIPWQWDYLGQHRQETHEPRGSWAWLYRLYWYVVVDWALHIVLTFLVQGLGGRAIRPFFRHIVPLTLIRGWRVVDRSQDMLIMEHELFVHIEIELFVTRDRLAGALRFAQELIAWHAGPDELPESTRHQLAEIGLLDDVLAGRGTYLHHYPICVRRVQPDDTLISMTSDGPTDYYALSFISYARPAERDGFRNFARRLFRGMTALFAARPHWGKFAPLSREDVDRLYPQAARFRAIRQQFDPQGVFQNAWTEELFGSTTRGATDAST